MGPESRGIAGPRPDLPALDTCHGGKTNPPPTRRSQEKQRRAALIEHSLRASVSRRGGDLSPPCLRPAMWAGRVPARPLGDKRSRRMADSCECCVRREPEVVLRLEKFTDRRTCTSAVITICSECNAKARRLDAETWRKIAPLLIDRRS